jgi:N-acetylglucosamine-6-sulfatase
MRATRSLGKAVFAALLVAGSLVAVSVSGGRVAHSATQPNIVMILTDDQWTESMAYMPKTNALLVDNGISFSNFHVSNPLCCPSRSTFLTGQYSHNHGVESNGPPDGGFQKFNDTSTLATWLHGGGYHTTLIGKYLNGYGSGASATYIPPGWDNWQAATQGTQNVYNYTINENGTSVHYGTTSADFKTDVFANKAVANINARAGLGPFFMDVAVTAPHNEFANDTQSCRAAPRHEGIFANEPFPLKKSFNEADVSDKPQWVRNLPLRTPQQQANIVQSWRDKLECIRAIDDLVESVVNALSAQGVLDNTIIMFSSDNGFFFGEHRIQAGKNRVYEEATRVPLVINGGTFTGGKTRKQVVANIDLAPTIAALAGVTPGLTQDGISLVPYATSSKYRDERAILLENAPSNANTFNAIRTKKWVYSKLGSSEEELYDIGKDPLQLTSKHAQKSLQKTKAKLAAALDVLDDCAGAVCNLDFNG